MTEVKQFKKRSSAPKVRSGCKTCKARRVKCDEARNLAGCNRCIKAGIVCGGYPLDPNSRMSSTSTARLLIARNTSQSKETSPSSDSSSSSPVYLSSPASPEGKCNSSASRRTNPHNRVNWRALFVSEAEYKYFNYFRTETIPSIAGFFDSVVWGNFMLQACHREQYARHAVVALGAIHRSTIFRTRSSMSGQRSQEREAVVGADHDYAVKQYAKSLQFMRQLDLGGEESEYNLRNALVSCIFTLSFEFFCSGGSGVRQAQMGIQLLTRFLEQRHGSNLPSIEKIVVMVDLDLIGIFARIQTGLHKRLRPSVPLEDYPPDGHSDERFLGNMMPEFYSIKVARFYWDILERRTVRWRAAYGFEENSSIAGNSPNIYLWSRYIRAHVPRHLLTTMNDHISRHAGDIERWHRAFLPLFVRSRGEARSSIGFQGASILQMKYFKSMFTYGPGPNIDPALPIDSKPIVDIARELLESVQTLGNREHDPRAFFSTDDSVLGSLFEAAVCGEDMSVRQEAIRLMRQYPRREECWDSSLTATIATWFMMEQERLGTSWKTQLETVSKDYRTAQVTVQCSAMVDGQPILLAPVILNW
ncbi:hypothetical protein HYALB_00000929 [Hymenoscyphus albidus]|uniref:Zn(2)-C6 fungal-type domain-containing protein n=1 Tax=Hymenoscyphus albidus TaxID=595503 RepID=A0A9N9PQ53_9HELO|nr:hypothetical protein HYALB_00000929 [Hymenoscyphus albidus]